MDLYDDCAWSESRNCYVEPSVHMAWKGWQAAIQHACDVAAEIVLRELDDNGQARAKAQEFNEKMVRFYLEGRHGDDGFPRRVPPGCRGNSSSTRRGSRSRQRNGALVNASVNMTTDAKLTKEQEAMFQPGNASWSCIPTANTWTLAVWARSSVARAAKCWSNSSRMN